MITTKKTEYLPILLPKELYYELRVLKAAYNYKTYAKLIIDAINLLKKEKGRVEVIK